MKKILKFLGIGLLLILLALFLIPLAFQGKVKDIALAEANKMLKSEAYVGDVSLSFFKNFPHASITLYDFGVAGKGEFEGDTLLNAGRLIVVVSTRSLLTDHYVVNAFKFENAYAKAVVHKNGNANWDILVADTTAQEEAVDTTKAKPFALSLRRVNFDNVNVQYINEQDNASARVDHLDMVLSGQFNSTDQILANISDFEVEADSVGYADTTMSAGLKNFEFTFSGDVSEAVSNIKSKLGIRAVDFAMQHIPYLSGAKVDADMNVAADLQNNKFTLGENTLSINEIKANLTGFVQLVDSATIDMDLKFNTPKLEFKDILSLIPAIYKSDFGKIQTNGKVALDAAAKGRMQGENFPAFDVKLVVENAMFKYPDLPKQIDNINVNAEVKNPGGILDKTVVDVNKFAFKMAGNPFSAHLVLKDPISDPDFDCGVKGIIDFNSIKDVIALDGMNLSGVLNADASAQGKLSYAEKEQYENFTVNGNLNVKNMNINGKEIGYDVKVNSANLDFSNKALDLTECNVNIGKNDIALNGKLENFLPYIFSDGTIKGKLNVKSNYFNVNDFISVDTTATVEDPAPASSESVEIPGNIDFAMNLAMEKVIYSNIELNQVKGALTVRDRVASITNLSTNTMEGSLNMKGSYDSKDKNNTAFKADMQIQQMSIPKVFSTVNTAKKFVPLLSNATGKFNMKIDLNSKLDASMSPILNTVNAKGTFSTDELGLKEFDVMKKISSAVNFSKLSESSTLKNVRIKFQIKDGRMSTEPFNVSMSGTKMDVTGTSGLDETLDYTLAMAVPNSVSSKTNIPLKFNVLVGGTFNSPKIKVDAKGVVDNVKEVVTEKVKETVKQTVNKALEEAKAKQAKMLAEAKKQASALKSEAEKQGDKLVAEAKAQGDKMVASSKNPLEKKAKQKAAQKLVQEAEKKKNKLVSDATTKGNSIIDAAQTKSDKMIKEAEAKNNK